MATITWSDVTQIAHDVCGVPSLVAVAVVAQANGASVCGLAEPVEKLARVYLAAHYASLSGYAIASTTPIADTGTLAVKRYTLGPETIEYADTAVAGATSGGGTGYEATLWGKLYLDTVKSGSCAADWIVTRV